MGADALAKFIEVERETILAEWETFTRTLLPAAGGMSVGALRDHSDEILTAIVADMRSSQSRAEQAEKSKGRGDAQKMSAMGEVHVRLRIGDGFKLGQIVAEYRALRASVLRLWEKQGPDLHGVTRFNEAIDEALAVAVHRFTETADQFRDESLGILGHDLRNPLASIVTGSSLLIATTTLDDRTVSIAARMLSSAKRMDRMIDDLLDLTRTRFGQMLPITPVAIDLEPLCRQVLAELDGLRTTGELRFVGKGDLRGEWDSDRIAQVLSNLLRNAIEHGDAGTPIELLAVDEGDDVRIEVHNSGAVIPERARAAMFEPSMRKRSGEKSTGLGLGLYIASQVVSSHGGKLAVTSTAAGGTTFRLLLPRRLPVDPKSKRPSSTSVG